MKHILIILIAIICFWGCLEDVETEYINTGGYANCDTLSMEVICLEGEITKNGLIVYYWNPDYPVESFEVWKYNSSNKIIINKSFIYEYGIPFACEDNKDIKYEILY